jgi:hypothetical protein
MLFGWRDPVNIGIAESQSRRCRTGLELHTNICWVAGISQLELC